MTDGSDVVLRLTLNGAAREELVDVRMLLVEALRGPFGLTGPKIGCLTGDCGACTVRIEGVPQKACLHLACATEGARIETVESLADEDDLSPVQAAFRDAFGFQCGFCVSGMLLCAEELLATCPDPSDEQIRAAIGGNLCRCTGYDSIVEAIHLAAARATSTHNL